MVTIGALVRRKDKKNLFSCSNARSHQMFQTRGVHSKRPEEVESKDPWG